MLTNLQPPVRQNANQKIQVAILLACTTLTMPRQQGFMKQNTTTNTKCHIEYEDDLNFNKIHSQLLINSLSYKPFMHLYKVTHLPKPTQSYYVFKCSKWKPTVNITIVVSIYGIETITTIEIEPYTTYRLDDTNTTITALQQSRNTLLQQRLAVSRFVVLQTLCYYRDKFWCIGHYNPQVHVANESDSRRAYNAPPVSLKYQDCGKASQSRRIDIRDSSMRVKKIELQKAYNELKTFLNDVCCCCVKSNSSANEEMTVHNLDEREVEYKKYLLTMITLTETLTSRSESFKSVAETMKIKGLPLTLFSLSHRQLNLEIKEIMKPVSCRQTFENSKTLIQQLKSVGRDVREEDDPLNSQKRVALDWMVNQMLNNIDNLISSTEMYEQDEIRSFVSEPRYTNRINHTDRARIPLQNRTICCKCLSSNHTNRQCSRADCPQYYEIDTRETRVSTVMLYPKQYLNIWKNIPRK
uniref:Phlebovirus_G2 domain-containing protein n=1 Tax=Heterorhabditis bacteriophora TaxID=37862 RepID=A0A1I7WGB7_HETBA